MAKLWNRVRRVWSARDTDDSDPDALSGQAIAEGAKFQLAPGDTDRVMASPEWLRRAGMMSWYVIGVSIAVLGVLYLLAKLQFIFVPLVVAVVVAILFDPLVTWLVGHGWSRGLASAVTVFVILGVTIAIVVFTIWSIAQSVPSLTHGLQEAVGQAQRWMKQSGFSASQSSSSSTVVVQGIEQTATVLIAGVASAITGLAALVIGTFLTMFILLFALTDLEKVRTGLGELLPLPGRVARVMMDDVANSTRAYFKAVTIVGVINGIVMAVAAILLGVPLAGAIAVITALTSYIPFFGAFIAGAVAGLIAYGAKGMTAAIIMIVISLLYNNVASNILQPLAAGKTMSIHPLIVLLSTTIGAILFGLLGAVLAAPIASSYVTIRRDFRDAQKELEGLDGALAASSASRADGEPPGGDTSS